MSEQEDQLPNCIHCKFNDRGFPCRDAQGGLSIERLVESLLICCQHEVETPEYEVNAWADECARVLVEEAPETAFRVILAALPHFKADLEIAQLAAGPLEDLVTQHGERMIDEIEREALSNERFRYLLSGIWGQAHVPPKVWHRIQSAVEPGPLLDDDPRTPHGTNKGRDTR